VLQVLEYLEDHLDREGSYPPIESLPPNFQQIIYADPNKFNNLLRSAHLPTYYVPPALNFNQSTPIDPPVGRFKTDLLEELGSDRISDKAMKQKMAIKLVLDVNDSRTLKAKLTSIGATTIEYGQWLKDPTFLKKLNTGIDRRFSNLQGDAKLGLAKLVIDGDLQAIKYFHEFTGLFKPENETVVNLTKILAQLMEVLVRYIDPGLLSQIADELESKVLGIEVKSKELTP